jgi:hypothetical protein
MVDNKVLETSPEHQYTVDSSTITMPAGKYASIGITSSNVLSGSSQNYTFEDVLKDLRVVEYTKNGKITRVELQRLDRKNDTWVKIPRIKIEEEK